MLYNNLIQQHSITYALCGAYNVQLLLMFCCCTGLYNTERRFYYFGSASSISIELNF